MNRKKHVEEIIDSIQRTKQKVCWKMSKMPNIAITPSQWALLHILHHVGSLSVKELAHRLAITGSAVTQMTKDLEDKRLVKRVSDKTDRRIINIELSKNYDKAMAQMHKEFTEECANLFKKLTDTELATLNRLHKKIVD